MNGFHGPLGILGFSHEWFPLTTYLAPSFLLVQFQMDLCAYMKYSLTSSQMFKSHVCPVVISPNLGLCGPEYLLYLT